MGFRALTLLALLAGCTALVLPPMDKKAPKESLADTQNLADADGKNLADTKNSADTKNLEIVNLALGHIPTGSSDSVWGRYPSATDGSLTTMWHANENDYPSWLKLDLGASHIVSHMEITIAQHSNYGFKTLKIYRDSNMVRTDYITHCASERKSSHSGWAESTREVKIQMEDRCGGGAFAIAEWAIYGYRQTRAGTCLLYTGKQCDADFIERKQSITTIAACKTFCAAKSGCTHFSSTINTGDCLMFDSCASPRIYGDGTLGTKTYSMAPCPTPAPTPPPGGSGDPHVVNVRGEHFEVFQLGEHTLVHLPRSAPASETLLDVKVKIAPCNHDLFSWNCKSRFIEDVNISGSLIGEKKSVHFSAGKLIEKQEILTARSGDGKLWHHRHDLHFDLHSSKYGPVRMTATTGKAGTGMKLHLGDAATIFVQSKQSKFKNAGKKDVHWLDVSVRGLQNLGGDIGGLLGLDDHTKAAAVPEECTGLKEKMMQKISSGAPPRTAVQDEAGMA